MAAAAGNLVRRMTVKKFEEIPGPKSYPIIGTLHNYLPFYGDYNLDRLHHSGLLKYKRYGKMVKEEIVPGVQLLFLFDPVDIETLFRTEGRYPCRRSHTALEKFRMDTPLDHKSGGLLPTNGVQWANMRGQYQQSLNRENVRTFISQTDDIALEFLHKINDPSEKIVASSSSSNNNNSRDFLPYLMSVYLEIIGSNLFSVRFGALSSVGKADALAQRLIRAAEEVNSSTIKADNGLRLWRWVDTPLYRSIKRNLGLLEQVSREVVQTRLLNKTTDSPSCLLKTWLAAEEGNGQDDTRDIVTMSADMVLAGIDTTAFSSSFILYHLATHEHHQEELYRELRTLLPTWETPVTSEVLVKAAYLKKVVKESLRLNPISIGIGRVLTQDTVIGDHHIPQGTVIVTQNQVTCRLDQYFDRANEFLPERWESKVKRPHPYTMIPFGHGPRACIGRRLAEQNMYIVIAKLIRRFQFQWNGTRKLDCLSHTINKPDQPLIFTLTPRSE